MKAPLFDAGHYNLGHILTLATKWVAVFFLSSEWANHANLIVPLWKHATPVKLKNSLHALNGTYNNPHGDPSPVMRIYHLTVFVGCTIASERIFIQNMLVPFHREFPFSNQSHRNSGFSQLAKLSSAEFPTLGNNPKITTDEELSLPSRSTELVPKN